MQPIETGIPGSQTRLVALVEDILTRNRPDGTVTLPEIPTNWDLVEIGLALHERHIAAPVVGIAGERQVAPGLERADHVGR